MSEMFRNRRQYRTVGALDNGIEHRRRWVTGAVNPNPALVCLKKRMKACVLCFSERAKICGHLLAT